MLNYFPKYFTNKAILLYFIALLAVTFVFFSRSMNVLWMVFGIVEVAGFFYFSNLLTLRWSKLSDKTFRKRLMYTSATIRIVWVIFSYFFYLTMTGQPFEFGAADSQGYHETAIGLREAFLSGNFKPFFYLINQGFSDSGYVTYLSIIYLFTGKSILIARLLKVLWSTWTVILVYKLATRSFGQETGRIAGILTMLMPNLILYCGLHLKETEMVFLTVAFLERADYLLRSKNFSFKTILVPFIITLLLFSFRTVLGVTALFSLLTSLLFSTKKILGFGQRFIIGFWVAIAVVYFMGGRIASEVEQLVVERNTSQRTSMEWRAQREGGNTLADRASAAIFAPAIFIIPIPTMVNIETQEHQMLINGGNFNKDIMSFFLMVFIFVVVKRNTWRDFSLLEAFFFGYLIILAFSQFAQSERFHQPILPLYMMFAAYGITQVTNSTKKYFTWYMVLLFAIIIAWNWFKLAGRGMA
ncbi:MAG: hypothetical protein EOM44_13720 [Bacteroidia bacterium]|nr:hypothetical protein [Bacteroidia bacterium]